MPDADGPMAVLGRGLPQGRAVAVVEAKSRRTNGSISSIRAFGEDLPDWLVSLAGPWPCSRPHLTLCQILGFCVLQAKSLSSPLFCTVLPMGMSKWGRPFHGEFCVFLSLFVLRLPQTARTLSLDD